MTAIAGVYQPTSSSGLNLHKIAKAADDINLDRTSAWSPKNPQHSSRAPLSVASFWNSASDNDALRCDPHFSQEYGLAIIIDSRLDDREALQKRLGRSTDTNKIPADNLLVLDAYKKWGEDCPKHIIGDYAFVIWDGEAQKLFCARDHIGAKPFYYSNAGDRFVFGSDIRLVLADFEDRLPFDEQYVSARLVDWGHYSLSDTAYENVSRLAPGHSLTISNNGQQLKRYWEPEKLEPLVLKDDDAYAQTLLNLLEKAVTDCLRIGPSVNTKDQPKFGTHVSGGLDSSAIAVIANRYFRGRNQTIPTAFSWQPSPDLDKPLSPEHSWIEAIVEDQQLDMHYVTPNPDDIYRMFLRDGTCEPTGATLINEEAVQKAARKQNIGILLSGWGGDEFVSHNGRAHYPEMLRTGQWRKLLSELSNYDENIFKSIFTRAIAPAYWPSFQQILQKMRAKKKKKAPKNPFVSKKFQRKTQARKRGASRFTSTRETQLDLLNRGHITERIELWAANARSMGLEYRYPLLDRRLIEFALSIPTEQFKRGRWKRWIFRNATKDILPDIVCWNLSKLETVRTDAMSGPIAEAFGRIGDGLRSGSLKTTRGEYVDLPQLIDMLDAEKYRKHGNLGPTRVAVEFLDFE